MSFLKNFLMSLALVVCSASAFADAEVGKAAPDFTAVDSAGVKHSLKDLKGKIVVLEWTNDGCPFVKKHYESGNMQKLQANARKDGVVWLSVLSSSKGKQGYYEPKELEARRLEANAKDTPVLLDTDGKIGKAYGAKNTPHMFVVDAAGKVAYRGAIDSIDSAEAEDVAKAKNYVSAAIEDLNANRKVAVADTKPYGCGIKYKN